MERQEAGKVKSGRKDVKWNGEVEEGDVRKRRGSTEGDDEMESEKGMNGEEGKRRKRNL